MEVMLAVQSGMLLRALRVLLKRRVYARRGGDLFTNYLKFLNRCFPPDKAIIAPNNETQMSGAYTKYVPHQFKEYHKRFINTIVDFKKLTNMLLVTVKECITITTG